MMKFKIRHSLKIRRQVKMSLRPLDKASDDTGRDTRERILAEADRLFRHYGYSKTTVADIARELGMSPGNIYRFFASKAAINEAMAERMLAQRVAESAKIAKGEGSPEARLRAVLLANHAMTIGVLTEEKKVHEMVAIAMSQQWDVIKSYIAEIVGMMADLIAEGIAKGDFAEQDPHLSARCLHQAFIAFVHPNVVAECIDDKDRTTAEQMVDFIVKGLRNR
jgi:AcrR family transcriptional regulator